MYFSVTLQRERKIQKERLAEEFTAALNVFQATQRIAAQKEKEQMQRVRANSGLGLGDPFGGLLNIKRQITVNKMFCRMFVARIQKAWSLVYWVAPANVNVSVQAVNNLIVVVVGPFMHTVNVVWKRKD